jgi:putative ABC transport system permease protein
MKTQNIRLVFRNLLKNRLYSSLSILGFAVGFAVCTIIALYAYNEFTINQCYPEYKRIVRLIDDEKNNCDLDYDLNALLKEKYPEIKDACPLEFMGGRDISVKTPAHFTKFRGIITTTNDFFSVFPIDVIKRFGSQPFEGNESVIITESLAKSLFSDEEPLGKSIIVHNFITATVTAVIKDFPAGSGIQASLLLNSANERFRFTQVSNNGKHFNPTNHFLLLQPGTDIGSFTAKLNQSVNGYQADLKKVRLQKLSNIYFSDGINGSHLNTGNKTLVLIYIFVGLIILILSVINYLNFNVSMQYAKLKEVGIKKINGASFGHLLNSYLFEVSVNILLSVGISLIIATIFLPVANPLLDRHLEITMLFSPALILVFSGIILITVLVNSFTPLYFLSRFDIRNFLSGSKSNAGKQNGKNILTVFQFAASIALLAVVLTLSKQISYVKHADLGFNQELLVRLNLPMRFNQQQTFKQQISQLTFCRDVSLSRGVPGYINATMGSNSGEGSFELQCIYADADFLNTMGIRMKDGRNFLPGDMGKTCIMNKAAIERYGWENINDKRFNNGQDGGYQVIGETENFNITSLRSGIQPVCLLAASNLKDLSQVSVRLSPGNIGEQMKTLGKVWKSFIPDEPMDYSFYDDYFNSLYKSEERLGKAIGLFAIVAFILTCMGILGQIFQTCIDRTKEIGIRKINGAKVSEVIMILNKDFVKWVVIAFVIATPIAYYAMDKWFESFAYKTPLSWWIFALAGLLALGIALLTVSWQSWKAATRNPVEALRYE